MKEGPEPILCAAVVAIATLLCSTASLALTPDGTDGPVLPLPLLTKYSTVQYSS
jgi:hypothetical protein